jgi:hypothetical protein
MSSATTQGSEQMSVSYVGFRGKVISREWAAVLTAAAHEVAFQIDSGHRTMGEQQALYNHFLRFGSPVAATPSATAPHIRTGRFDHALDINALDGGAARLFAWLCGKGAHPAFPVRGEPWHIEVPANELRALATRLADPLRGYTASERRWIREYDQLKHARRDRKRRGALRHVMKAQRKRVWRAAQPTSSGGDGRGWHDANRRARYRSLLARTT